MPKSPYDHPEAFDLLKFDLAPYAVAVGALCNAWAALESSTRMLFIKVSGMPADRLSFGLVHCLDVRDLLKAIKLAFVDKTRGQPQLMDFALETINYIDDVLRLRRNRYVHDFWSHDFLMDTVERFQYTPHIFRPQANQPRDWSIGNIHTENIDDLWATVREVRDHANVLTELQICFSGDMGATDKLLRSRPKQQFRRPQPEMPRPSDSAEQAPQSPPESSQG